ncbi:protein translocase subunit SecD [Cereibacter sphaeroides]|uniref:protein translocase subunit SecD n=1 Tax=Cereibacter sphaeroides TaxID=1063 RepID=UPI001F45C942|nr:protein translocase subunit SecD [Cereibacter sphaeroides]MCE6959014.1 protein translocase subunit SecD [Cereibacter sphaeroides]MCE6973644.1 protein translocase subunit SecD [Cereibacter sphaeroides]
MFYIPLWKRVLIWGICALAILYASPNFFYSRVESRNDAVAAIEKAGGTATPEQQAAAGLWPDWLPSSIVNLGLDLRGGAHLLAEVQVEDVYVARMDAMWPDVRDALRGLRDEVGSIRRQPAPPGVLRVALSRAEGMPAAVEAVRKLAQPIISFSGMGQTDIEVAGDGEVLTVQMTDAQRAALDSHTVQQSLEIIRRRVDEVGTREPTIQRQGEDRILIQVPGIGSAAELKSLIGTTAKLTFHPVLGRTADAGADAGGNLLLPSADEQGIFYIIERAPVVSGEDLVDAQPSFDQNNRPAVSFRFDPAGARAFGDYTAENIGKPFAIVLDEEVISAPVIQAHIAGGSGIITGNFSVEESTELAVLLRAGALPAEMTFLEERTVGPELGQDSIDAGRTASIVGMIAVVFFMIASYGWFGVMANVALAINVMGILAILSLIGATLTLPGIAGIVLTMGMAVDANVLIYERIREELRQGKQPGRAIELGFEKALSAIVDANVTTFLVAVIMFAVGSGTVRGFAVTLAIGIMTSVFTAVYVTRVIVATWFAWRRPRTITV